MTDQVPVRIGDAERDEALDKLGEHFAAGRLTREELDERSESALAARFDSDLEPLFADLPRPAREVATRPTSTPARAAVPPLFPVLAAVLVLVTVASIVLHGPVLIAPIFWLFILSGWGRRHRFH